ncbi:MAG TPA: thioredoxin domain-containing protein [Candidatus Koribacter sp.]|jgi:protein-disulfide isomerase/rhodanese-related sulfurtransferase
MRKTLALVFSLFGLFDSAYLWWVYTSPTHPLVCLGTGCDEVRASRFAFWGGIPTPAFGAVMYAALVVLLLVEPFAQPKLSALLRRLAFSISAGGLVISLYLTSLEAFQIHAWCAWCVAQQIAIAIIFALLAIETSRPAIDDPKRVHRTALQNVLVFVICVVIAVPAFAWLSKHSAAEEKKQISGTQTQGAPDLSHLVEPNSHAAGPADAPVTVVEFGDFQCPSCIVAEATNQDIRKRFPKQVRFIFRNFPLTKFHPFAEKAAEAAECAAEQDKFWPMHDRMYSADGELAVVQLKFYAQDIGLDTAKFNSCLDSGEKASRVQEDVTDGKAAGVGATPTFYINGQQHVGGLNLQDFTATVSSAPAPKPAVADAPAQPKPAPLKAVEKQASPAAAPKSQPVMTAAASTAIVPGLAPAPNPLALGSSDSGDCDVNGPKGPGKNEIPTTVARDLLKKGATFVDIRQPKDFAKSHIRGAVNLPLSKLSDGVSSLPKDKPVVVYESGLAKGDVCASSRAAAGLIASRGFKDVKVYHDGFTAWQKAGGPVQ